MEKRIKRKIGALVVLGIFAVLALPTPSIAPPTTHDYALDSRPYGFPPQTRYPEIVLAEGDGRVYVGFQGGTPPAGNQLILRKSCDFVLWDDYRGGTGLLDADLNMFMINGKAYIRVDKNSDNDAAGDLEIRANSVGIGTLSVGTNNRLTIKSAGSDSGYYGLKVQNSGGTDQFVVRSDGNIGIGTTSLQEKLTLASGYNFATEMYVPTITSIYGTTGGSLSAGTYYIKIVASDGVGTTIGSSEDSATVDGISSNAINVFWTEPQGASSYRIYVGTSSGGQNRYHTDTDSPFLLTAYGPGDGSTSGTVPTVTTAYVNKITASGNSWFLGGNVAIGTASPSAKLEVLGTSTQLRLSYDGTHITDFKVDTNHDLLIKPSSTGQIKLQPTTDSTDFFQVWDADGGDYPILNVDATNERVGIGTSDPGATFVVRGDAVFNENGDSYNDFRIEGDDEENLFFVDAGNKAIGIKTSSPKRNVHIHHTGDYNYIQMTTPDTGSTVYDGFRIGIAFDSIVRLYNEENSDIEFWTNGQRRMIIENNGNVGIHVSAAPYYDLEIGSGGGPRLSFSGNTNPSTPPLTDSVVIYFDGEDLKAKDDNGMVITIADF